jgi:hypothetical protein
MITSVHLSKNKNKGIDQIENSWMIKCFMYVINYTMLDIAYLISKMNRFVSTLSMDHWKTIKRILKHLRYTLDHGVYYSGYLVVFEGYIDANWISKTKNLKSISGYVFTNDRVVVSWKSSKKTCIGRSTMKSEFITIDKVIEEAEWL